jgi:hypothetical protein
MAGIKIVNLPALGRNLASTDLFELSLAGGTGSRKITGQEILNTAKSGLVPDSRTLTINGTTQDLSVDRTFTISTGITIGTTAITSGTVGRVLFEGTENVVQESAGLTWDNTNARFGIVGGAKITALVPYLILESNHWGESSFIQNGVNIIANSTGNYFNIFNPAGKGFSYTRASGVDFAITPNGNVLINTTTDAGFKLDVNGTARTKYLTVESGSLYDAIQFKSNTGLIGYLGSDTASVFLSSSTGGTGSYLSLSSTNSTWNAPQNVIFRTANTERARIDSTGNVGIGTSSPSVKLSIVGLGTAVNNSIASFLNGSVESRIFNTSTYAGLGVWSNNDLRLFVDQDSTKGISVKTSTGNVLINTTTDAGYKLDVNGIGRVSGTLTLGISGTAGIINFNRASSGTLQSAISQSNDALIYSNFQGSGHVFNVTAASDLARVFVRSTGLGITGTTGGLFTMDASALLQGNSTTQGWLPPRMTQVQRNAIASPAIGLEIYQTDATEGKYIYKSSGWTYIG